MMKNNDEKINEINFSIKVTSIKSEIDIIYF